MHTNAYSVSYSFSNCHFPFNLQNGTTATGLACVDSSVTPNRVVVRQVQSCADIGSRNTSVTR